MSQFSDLIEKFQKARDDIKALGTKIIEDYPQSKRLTEMAEEIDTAVQALDSLASGLATTFQTAEQEDNLKKELLEQMHDSDVYSKLKSDEQNRLAEFLVQSGQPLATNDMLLAYVEKSLGQKSSSDLIAMYPKAMLLKVGKDLDDGSDGFDAYAAGLDAIKKEFDADKSNAVKRLSRVWVQQGMDAIAREFYATALSGQEEV